MPKLTDSKDKTDPVLLVNERAEQSIRSTGSRRALYQEVMDAYNSKGYVDDPEGVHIKINRLRAAIKQNVPRHATALWPQRPYIDFRAKNDLFSRRAKNKVKVIDGENERAKYWKKCCDWLEKGEAFGNAGMEVGWDAWNENVEDRKVEVDPMTGQVVKISRDSYEKQMDGLKLKVHGPHACLWSPGGPDALSKTLIIVEVLPNDEIERMVDEGNWELGKGVTREKLKAVLKQGPSAGPYGDWESVWQGNLSGYAGAARDNVSVLTRLFSPDRWITSLNYTLALQDTENRHKNMDKRRVPLAWLTINAHISDESFWGDGEWAMIRDLAEYDDMLLSLYLEARLSAGNPVVLYNSDAIGDKTELVLEPGAAIPVNLPAGRKLSEGIDYLVPPQQNNDLLDLHSLFGDMMDNRMGQHGISRGEIPSPKQTVGVTRMALEEGVTRLGHQTRYVENDGLFDLNFLVTKYCGTEMSLVQIMDQGGLSYDDAVEVATPDPSDLPGGFEWELQGSERVVRRQEKDQKLLDTFNLVANQQAITAGPGAIILTKAVIERSETLDDKQMEDMMLDEQIEAAKQMLTMQLQGGPPPVDPNAPLESVGQDGAVMPPNQVGEQMADVVPAQGVTAA